MVSRANEIKKLKSLYTDNNSQTVLIYGLRGCLKEELIKDFAKDTDLFYYRARNISSQSQFNEFSKEIKKSFNCSHDMTSYNDCFKSIFDDKKRKAVVVIDDFEYIAKKDESFLEAVHAFKEDMFIILASCAMSWINNDFDETIKAKNSVIDNVIKLEEVGFLDVVRAFPRYSVEESVSVYGILGGTPSYLNRWSQTKPLKANICDNILNPNGYLYEEVMTLLGAELRELGVYNTILMSIARGNEKLNDLHNDTTFSRAKISVYLKNLSAFDIVSKVVSFETGGWDNTKKGVYRISNNLVNFYFYFIYPNLSQLTILKPDKFYDTYIRDELPLYLERYFVNVCKEYLELLNKVGKCSIKIDKIGTWLGKSGTIDIVAQDNIRNSVVGKCNWKDKELNIDDYNELKDLLVKARINPTTIYLFSAKSFDSNLVRLSEEDPKVVLVDMKEL